jgi:hypothetical protein
LTVDAEDGCDVNELVAIASPISQFQIVTFFNGSHAKLTDK